MPRTAWRTPISGFLLLRETCSEGVAADAPDRCSLAAILAAAIPAAADFHYPPALRDRTTSSPRTEATPPTADNTMIASAAFLKMFRIFAPDQIRTGQEWT
jgi:hypothetical protein